MLVDSVDRHLTEGTSIEDAAIVPGLFIAFCVNMGLVSAGLAASAERAMIRLKYREITGGEFLVSACGGDLNEHDLSENGVAFARQIYPSYLEAVVELVDELSPKWETYDLVAPWLTERYFGRGKRTGKRTKRWWRLWN